MYISDSNLGQNTLCSIGCPNRILWMRSSHIIGGDAETKTVLLPYALGYYPPCEAEPFFHLLISDCRAASVNSANLRHIRHRTHRNPS